MNVEEAVGMELSACRHKKRISQERLGFDTGVHRTYVSLIERGVKSPTVGVLFRLCQALDMAPMQPPQTKTDKRILEMISKYHGSPIVWLRRSLPLSVRLEWHRNNIFQRQQKVMEMPNVCAPRCQ